MCVGVPASIAVGTILDGPARSGVVATIVVVGLLVSLVSYRRTTVLHHDRIEIRHSMKRHVMSWAAIDQVEVVPIKNEARLVITGRTSTGLPISVIHHADRRLTGDAIDLARRRGVPCRWVDAPARASYAERLQAWELGTAAGLVAPTVPPPTRTPRSAYGLWLIAMSVLLLGAAGFAVQRLLAETDTQTDTQGAGDGTGRATPEAGDTGGLDRDDAPPAVDSARPTAQLAIDELADTPRPTDCTRPLELPVFRGDIDFVRVAGDDDELFEAAPNGYPNNLLPQTWTITDVPGSPAFVHGGRLPTLGSGTVVLIVAEGQAYRFDCTG